MRDIVAHYPATQKFVIYCSCPNEVSAALMAQRLKQAGFADALALRGGLDAWRDTGRQLIELAPQPPSEAPVLAAAPKTA
ncbi:dedA family protein [Burkholderia pseudomallei]|nr:dedA family protein [Burkholderia pseudomallei]